MDKFLLENSEIEYKKQNLYDRIFAIAVVVIALFFVFVSQFWISISVVQMNSMCDTLIPGDKLVTDKLATPNRLDIVVFAYDENSDYIKRVIAVEGQTVYNDKQGNVYIEYKNKNGELVVELLIESYIKQGTTTYKNLDSFYIDENNSLFRVEVQKGEYFVMGDNRLVSIDSREFGCIKKEQIKGVVHQYWVDNKEFVGKIFKD